MHGITREEHTELRDKIIDMACEALNIIDYNCFHGKSYIYTMNYILEDISSIIEKMKRDFHSKYEHKDLRASDSCS